VEGRLDGQEVGGEDGAYDGDGGCELFWDSGTSTLHLSPHTSPYSLTHPQIASALGATVISTSSSQSKLSFAQSLGATHTINYATTPDWELEVLKLTGGKGVDHVIETGGAGTLMKSLAATRAGGQITLLGILTPNEKIGEGFVPGVLFGAKTSKCSFLYAFSFHDCFSDHFAVRGQTGFSRDALSELSAFVAAHGIKPVIAREFAFEDMVGAFEALQKQDSVGKIVVKIAEE
jgi:NADPH:quinone reductase-like Zn-dependent oxidoreductase